MIRPPKSPFRDRPHYMACVEDLLSRHRLEPGKVYSLEVRHDPWCGIFKGGPCDCEPVATLAEAGGSHPG